MHPRIEELLDNLAVHRATLRATIDEIPAERHAMKPGPGKWSIVDVLEHLGILERQLSGLFQRRIDEARAAGIHEETETTSVPLGPLSRERLLDRTRKLNAPDTVQPTSTLDTAGAWRALEAARERLTSAILSGDGLALGEITHAHPAFGTLTMYQWFVFIADHEARHTAQIREIAQQLQGT